MNDSENIFVAPDLPGQQSKLLEYAYINNWKEASGTPIKTNTYTYGDDTWGDLLTAYDGIAITYDPIGNPLNDGTWTYTWQNGRELASMTDGTATWSYTYDANGMRTQRSNGTTTYNYVYNGSQLSQMTVGSNTLNFAYDASGVPMMVTYNGTNYYYIVNLQGDVMGIVDSTGTIVVNYTYDAWGKPLSVIGSMADTLGVLNPLRYRGYVYDPETALYYVCSRYYHPEIDRWISPEPNVYYGEFDGNAGLLGYNVYAYCANNPVMFKDDTGEGLLLACILIGAGIGLIVGAVGGSHYAKHQKHLTPSDGWDYWKYVVFGGIGGGVLGGVAGWAFAGTTAAASISWASYKATTAIGTTSYAIGRAFEKWFYKAYNVVSQQVRYGGYRFDAIYKQSIVELKNYDWSKYSSYGSLVKSFVTQANNYMQFVGMRIGGQLIKGVTFCFSSKPPEIIIRALRNIGVTVNWLK